MSGIRFDKYEGLGNDFIVVDVESDDMVSASLARHLCDRRFGVGADGVLLVLPASTPGALARMRVINADGSIPEMCGNGLRCVALHLARKRDLATIEGTFDTDAGPRHASVERVRGHADVTVDMGEVKVLGEKQIDFGAETLDVLLADAGNPHALLLPIGEGNVHDRALLERVGPRIERHRDFPNGTNVELVTVEPDCVRVTVWERGVGITMACGTGAVAVTAALVASGRLPADSPVRVALPGGDLSVTIASGSARATMIGPARHVFSGQAP